MHHAAPGTGLPEAFCRVPRAGTAPSLPGSYRAKPPDDTRNTATYSDAFFLTDHMLTSLSRFMALSMTCVIYSYLT